MAISEESRHGLYGRLEDVLGREEAAVLMEHLPPVGWADVATRRDLDHAVEVLRADLGREVAGLRTEMADVRTEMAGLGADLRRELASVALDSRANLRTLFLGFLGLQVGGAGLVLAVARLL